MTEIATPDKILSHHTASTHDSSPIIANSHSSPHKHRKRRSHHKKHRDKKKKSTTKNNTTSVTSPTSPSFSTRQYHISKYQSYYQHKREKALKKRSQTLEAMFLLETQKTMELFGLDENGSSPFDAFHEIVKNIFLKEELPEEFRDDVDGLILALDEDKSGTLEVEEVNQFFRQIFKGKIQSKGFKRVRELKKMKTLFEIAQDSTMVQNYLLISNADYQLDTFFRSFVLSAELYTKPIIELSDKAPREMDPDKFEELISNLIEEAVTLTKEGRIYFDDLVRWYLGRLGGWSMMSEDAI